MATVLIPTNAAGLALPGGTPAPVIITRDQGPPGIQGPKGDKGDQGPKGDPGLSLYIQSTAPVQVTPYLWIQTGLGQDGKDITFWIEDGQP